MRVFTLAVGLGAGLLLGAYAVRRFDAARQAASPVHVAGRAGQAAGSFSERVRFAAEEGRRAARDREAELRIRYRVPDVTAATAPAVGD
ncbi:hypothetical protein [Egicoccus halophilus]|uniref:Uncharacterized protein n=1 Tax=Egicoccus halophilus TaxID=1670830 RepID=A0A8J3EUB2_9ACTN|nr:hypothetical protein [Egicoccus halophilus]GGI07337.1 hypothetical protein GCM10011354_23580 [Egicoccus halophilus]